MVDDAHVLSAATKAELETKFANLEARSTIQLVVATVPSLGGQEIEPYANTLFRAWRLGTAQKNNGVLLLVAPIEHRVRIEVGYGLEGTLTDAISSVIIANAAAPRFKAGDFDGGVTRASDDIITTLTSDASEWRGKADFQKAPAARAQDNDATVPVLIFLFILFVCVMIVRRSQRHGGRWFVPIDTGQRSGGGFSIGLGGGFSGGGGSSGGGGASGGW